ncbi:MAG: nucleoside phosphorylase [Candidatus Saccharibacteria bacterium]
MIEFDNNKKAIFNPQNLNFETPVKQAILVFDDDVWEDYILPNKNLETMEVKNNRGRVFDTYRIINKNNKLTLLVSPSTGGSGSVMEAELLIASGIEKMVAFGTCGSMNTSIAKNTLIVPIIAKREEGTSYHYLPPSDTVEQSIESIAAIENTFNKYKKDYEKGNIWTIDAVYRETSSKLEKLQNMGYIGVDMELASLLAMAKFREIKFAEFLIADDNIAGTPEKPDKEKNLEELLDLSFSILDKM